jgi:hypothetical protein
VESDSSSSSIASEEDLIRDVDEALARLDREGVGEITVNKVMMSKILSVAEKEAADAEAAAKARLQDRFAQAGYTIESDSDREEEFTSFLDPLGGSGNGIERIRRCIHVMEDGSGPAPGDIPSASYSAG